MRYSDEEYVRLYKRDTPGFVMMPWQGRALWPLLMRKLDRAGILELGPHGVDGLAEIVRLPVQLVAPGLAALEKAGYVVINGSSLVAPNFIEGQETPISDKQRKREQRERDRVRKLSREVTQVTTGHAASDDVTRGHSDLILSKLILTDPEKAHSAVADAPRNVATKKAAKASKAKEDSSEVEKAAKRLCEHYSAAWLASRLPLDGIPPKLQFADIGAARGLIRRFGEEAAKGLVDRYLVDPDPWLAKQGHPLRQIGTRADAYRAVSGPATRHGFAPPCAPVPESEAGEVKI